MASRRKDESTTTGTTIKKAAAAVKAAVSGSGKKSAGKAAASAAPGAASEPPPRNAKAAAAGKAGASRKAAAAPEKPAFTTPGTVPAAAEPDATATLQAVGADVVPSVPIEVDAPAPKSSRKKTAAAPPAASAAPKRSTAANASGSSGRAGASGSGKREDRTATAQNPTERRSDRGGTGASDSSAPESTFRGPDTTASGSGSRSDAQQRTAPQSSEPLSGVSQSSGSDDAPNRAPENAQSSGRAKQSEQDRASAGVQVSASQFSGAPLTQPRGAQPEPAMSDSSSAPAREARSSGTATEVQTPVSASASAPAAAAPESLITELDLHLFHEGTHTKLWKKLGAHVVPGGVMFGVWAPNAAEVSVIGDFNGWDPRANVLKVRPGSGVWEGFVPGIAKGTVYKFHIKSQWNDYRVDKTDPFAFHNEVAPRTASIVWDLDYEWNDDEWMRTRKDHNAFTAPMSIYEVHLGSWRRTTDDNGQTWRAMTFREAAPLLAAYARDMNFTHIELLPIMEHPFYGSWGYQCTGFFAPTSRYGTPQDLKYFVEVMHQAGIGVILDWVPSHFPTDEHGLSYFDGTHLFEHADPRKGFQPDWGSLIFNYGRNEVRAFLASSAMYWLEEYHIDGIRVDAVASMLYLDYSRKAGEWIPNEFGGRENVESIAFLRRLNEDLYKEYPDIQIIAEESTAWPMVSRPTYIGGLGFGMKWDMGWMHDTLKYFAEDPIHRRYHHNKLTFRAMYAFTENFVLPLSHDEVVHGKGSLIGKMPGDPWQKFANLRLLFAHMYSQPAKKLLFMGGEFGQVREWNHDQGLDFHLTDDLPHATLQRWVEDLNKAYRTIPALHELDLFPEGFDWIDCCDNDNSVMSLTRKSKKHPDEQVVVVMNFTPIPRHNYMIGVPQGGFWEEILNSDATIYGGSGQGNMGGVDAVPIPMHGRRWSVNLTLPPLGAVFLKRKLSGDDIAITATEQSEPRESAAQNESEADPLAE